MIRKVVIPAAGLGTRFLPATKSTPKEMLPIIDKPVIQYVVEEVIASRIDDILIITGRGKRSIEDHFDASPELEHHLEGAHKEMLLKEIRDISSLVDIHYIRQKEPRGLGDALLKAEKYIGGEPFAMLLGDDVITGRVPAIRQLIDDYERCKAPIIGVEEVPLHECSRYGIVDVAKRGRLMPIRALVEKPLVPPSNLAIVGRYVLTPEIFDCLHAVPLGHGGELQLTDGLARLLEDRPMYAREIEGTRYDVGDKLGYVKAILDFALVRSDLRDEVRAYLAVLAPERTQPTQPIPALR
jgi:UTP--glucose-1-phosphate uridylyltransferase